VARARRRFGQHFLTNTRILDRIADALGPGPGDRVLEIGPGHGALTRALVARQAQVTVIEIDRDLIPALSARFPEVRLVEADALELDWNEVMEPASGRWLVTGNIPYNITSPLIDKALTPPRPARIVFLVQKEVADRVTAAPGGGEFGALTVGVQSVAKAERLFTVPAGAFTPAPRVDSAVIRLTPLEQPLVSDRAIPSYRRMVTGLFGFRRKQLGRGLRELTGWPAERVSEILSGLEIEPSHRPEVLAPIEFARLHQRLVDGGWSGVLGL
jgi:16S rRNA (adenine1518-N6/adenine1519-N6)-dimethyltransferase